MKAIIFDFDGVIHDTFDFHKNKIHEFTGIYLSDQEFRDIHNGNFFHSVPKKIQHIDWEAYRDYIFYEQSNLKIKKEVEDTLLDLSKNYELHIISSGGTNNIIQYLWNNNLISIFKEILGLESHKSKVEKFSFIFEKHNLSPDECVFITDTLGDILEANKIGIKSIGCAFGFHGKTKIAEGDPYTTVWNFYEIQKVIENIEKSIQ